MFSGITPQGLSEKLVPRLPRNTGTNAPQKTGTKAYLKNWYQGLSEKLVPKLLRNTGDKALQKTGTMAQN